MSNENLQLSKQRPSVFTPIYRVLVLLLLAGIAIILSFSLFHKTSLAPDCEAAITKAQIIITSQSSIISDLQSSYQNAVYNNSKVTTIVQQTFLANEFEFNALQMIAMQNAALLEISTACH
jgi:cell division protein FtsL